MIPGFKKVLMYNKNTKKKEVVRVKKRGLVLQLEQKKAKRKRHLHQRLLPKSTFYGIDVMRKTNSSPKTKHRNAADFKAANFPKLQNKAKKIL